MTPSRDEASACPQVDAGSTEGVEMLSLSYRHILLSALLLLASGVTIGPTELSTHNTVGNCWIAISGSVRRQRVLGSLAFLPERLLPVNPVLVM